MASDVKTPWPICNTCQTIPSNIFITSPASDTSPFRLWPSFTRLADSAARGCHTCTLFYEAVYEPYKSGLETAELYLESSPTGEAEAREVVLTADIASLEANVCPEEARLPKRTTLAASARYTPIAQVKFVFNHDQIGPNAKHYKDLVSLYAEDDGTFRYIRQHLNDCLAQHQRTCDKVMFPTVPLESAAQVNLVYGAGGPVVAPTRLVYVGSDAANDPPKIVAGQECLYKGGYLVLSYCWGFTPPAAPWQLTTSTQPHFAAEIPMSVLPQTLHDAILWARRMEEPYIWIDGLCILQDSRDDWLYEASRMGSIYGSAKLTLVAASSSVYGGMSDRRNPLRSSAASLPVTAGPAPRTVYILPNGQRRATPLPPPTDSRGWCYQEDILSSRLVKITRTAVLWQCAGDASKPNVRAQGLESLTKHPPHRWYPLWYRFLERYSNTHLTYPADRLRACYGIACDKSAHAYVAGFLRSDPWASLLWCRDENQIRRRPGARPAEYVAPSWSWAALDAPVLFYEASGRYGRKPQLEPLPHYDAELHDASVEKASFFDTGAVKAGRVDLSACAVLARTAPPTEPFLFNTRLGAHTSGRRNLCDPATGRPVGLVVFDVAQEARNGMVLLCVLLHVVNVELWLKNGTAGLGIALKLTSVTPGHVSYARVGYVQFTSAFAKLCHRQRIEIV